MLKLSSTLNEFKPLVHGDGSAGGPGDAAAGDEMRHPRVVPPQRQAQPAGPMRRGAPAVAVAAVHPPAPGAFGGAPWRVLLSRHALAQLAALDLHLARAALAALAGLAGGRGWEASLHAADADPAAAAAQLGLLAPPPRGAPAPAAAATHLFVGDVAAATSAVVEVAPHCVDGAYAQVLRVHALERTAEVRRCSLNPVEAHVEAQGYCFSA